VQILLIYDCLYPNTVGGAELWLRALAERLGREHEVVYLTRRQWEGEDHGVRGFDVVPVSRGGPLYTPGGRRRLAPALAFGLGVFGHLVRRRGRYDVVHCLSYPYFSVLAVRLALIGRRGRPRVFIEWLECLSSGWWREYAGRVGGTLGRALQALCVRLTPAAFVFSDHSAARVRNTGLRGDLHKLPGLGSDPLSEAHSRGLTPRDPSRGLTPRDPRDEGLVLFAGRHMPDKRPLAAVEALAIARERRPGVHGVIVGDGPERPRVLARIRELGLEDAIEAPGFVEREELEGLVRRAGCVVAPSLREGFGMAVLESAAVGTPAVVCEAPDNAAAELVEPGVNGELAADRSPAAIAAALLRVLDAGPPLRESAAAWFERNRTRLSMEESMAAVEQVYRDSLRTDSTKAS
jgi:glycosyltransferase involved in cell wall biosynthesis